MTLSFSGLATSLRRQRAIFDGSLVLTPVDNFPAFAEIDHSARWTHGLYASDKIRSTAQLFASDIQFSGRGAMSRDINHIHRELAERLGGNYASLRMLSGLHAHIILFMGLARIGSSPTARRRGDARPRILLDMPALTMNEDGIFAQILFKFMWQRAVLARGGLDPSQRERPVFLWVDEAHHFLMASDADFLSTSRESLACPVFLSQSLPTFYAKMSGDKPRETVHQLLGNFATRIWHNNACHETNAWASQTIGKSLQQRANYSQGEGTSANFGMNTGEGENWGGNRSSGSSSGGSSGAGGLSSNWGSNSSSGSSWGGSDNWGRNRGHGSSSNVSHGYSEQMDDILTPGFFSSALKTGGPSNDNRVSAVWFQAGRKFQASHGNCVLVEFDQ